MQFKNAKIKIVAKNISCQYMNIVIFADFFIVFKNTNFTLKDLEIKIFNLNLKKYKQV